MRKVWKNLGYLLWGKKKMWGEGRDLITVFKTQIQRIEMGFSLLLQSNGLKLQQGQSRLEIRRNCPTMQVVKRWSRRPRKAAVSQQKARVGFPSPGAILEELLLVDHKYAGSMQK